MEWGRMGRRHSGRSEEPESKNATIGHDVNRQSLTFSWAVVFMDPGSSAGMTFHLFRQS